MIEIGATTGIGITEVIIIAISGTTIVIIKGNKNMSNFVALLSFLVVKYDFA